MMASSFHFYTQSLKFERVTAYICIYYIFIYERTTRFFKYYSNVMTSMFFGWSYAYCYTVKWKFQQIVQNINDKSPSILCVMFVGRVGIFVRVHTVTLMTKLVWVQLTLSRRHINGFWGNGIINSLTAVQYFYRYKNCSLILLSLITYINSFRNKSF